MKKSILVIILLFTDAVLLVAQKIDKVSWDFNKERGEVSIKYFITGIDKYKPCKVVPLMIRGNPADPTNQRTDTLNPDFLTGAFGIIENKGPKEIKWNIYKQMHYNELQSPEDVTFQLIGRCNMKHIKEQVFISYNVSGSSLLGLTIGYLSRWSGYIRFKTNGVFKSSELVFENGYVSNYPGTGYYVIDDNVKRSRFALTAGVMHRLSEGFYINLGVGYGYRTLLWHYKDYEYDRNTLIGEEYVKNQDKSSKGIEMELGVNYRINFILINAGINTINFSFFEPTLGIGYVFQNKKQ
jgi:hypothetical protein